MYASYWLTQRIIFLLYLLLRDLSPSAIVHSNWYFVTIRGLERGTWHGTANPTSKKLFIHMRKTKICKCSRILQESALFKYLALEIRMQFHAVCQRASSYSVQLCKHTNCIKPLYGVKFMPYLFAEQYWGMIISFYSLFLKHPHLLKEYLLPKKSIQLFLLIYLSQTFV